MKKYILALVVLLIFSSLSYSQSKRELKKQARQEAKVIKKKAKALKNFKGDPNNPITFNSKLIENNDIPYDGEFLFSFEFTNTGVDTLTVKGVRASCGCTQAKKPEKSLAPGESSVIAVTYDTKRQGAFAKSIYVMTDKTEPITLTIKGTVGIKP